MITKEQLKEATEKATIKYVTLDVPSNHPNKRIEYNPYLGIYSVISHGKDVYSGLVAEKALEIFNNQ